MKAQNNQSSLRRALLIGALALLGTTLASAQKKTTSSPPPPPPKTAAPAPRTNNGGANTQRNQQTQQNTRTLPQRTVTPQQQQQQQQQRLQMQRQQQLQQQQQQQLRLNQHIEQPRNPLMNGNVGPRSFDNRPQPAGMRREARGGGEMFYRANNQPRDFRRGDYSIHHSLNGRDRRLEYERADHVRFVAEHGGRGYIQRPYPFRARDGRVYEMGHRTFVTPSGHIVDRFYGSHMYRGVYVNYYVPRVYYRPDFYIWAYNPWARPMPYAWGWAGSPWTSYYGFYFSPYPVYPSAAYWLTDYMISASLAASYQNNMANQPPQQPMMSYGAPPPGASPLTPEVKDLVAQEVKRQLELESFQSQQSQTGVPDPVSGSIELSLRDNIKHVFLVQHSLDVVNVSGGECTVSQGDVLQLAGPPPPDSKTANLVVLSTKGGNECRLQDTVQVQFSDLQEMQNSMRESMGAGELQLQTKQGTGGLPQIPSLARGTAPQPDYVVKGPGADPNAVSELSTQYGAALRMEDQVVTGGPSADPNVDLPQIPSQDPSPARPVAPKIDIGETEEEVEAAFQPEVAETYDLTKGKTMFLFKDQKIFFKDGKVIEVQKAGPAL